MKVSYSQDEYIQNYYCRSPIFNDLKELLGVSQFSTWPDMNQLQELLPNNLCARSAKKLKFCRQDHRLPFPRMGYEERIYKTGCISTRQDNWHDYFNAMIWGLFPETKIMLNELHIEEIMKNKSINHNNGRTLSRDAITHLDESGIIIAVDDWRLVEYFRTHQWKKVFYELREIWGKQINAYVIGHGMYEKSLHPFIGMTAKMYPILMDSSFFYQHKQVQYQRLDVKLAKEVNEMQTLKNNHFLSPLPILGVPGWYEKNIDADFYDNQKYFRPPKKINTP
ncbi:MAG: DUF3025 domain-containing protein [Gammaproteobacteria bacterium]|nr:DUF3025 domain-containing protein [Gammaproteobacteria bacterium]